MSPPRNIAGRLAAMFIKSKLTPLLTLGILLGGVFALFMTPREENPQINVPAAQITVAFPGASAAEVEELVVTPLEGIVSEIASVDHTYAVADGSFAQVTVQFQVGEDREKALVELYQRVLRARDRLPPGASDPVVVSLGVNDVPIVVVTLASRIYDDFALKRLADRMSERLRSVEGVSVVDVYGGVDREVRIEFDPDRLAAFGIPLNRVRDVLNASNVALPVGEFVIDGHRQPVEVDGFLKSAEELRGLIIGQLEGRPIFLADIADIVDGPPTEREDFSRFSPGPADPGFAKSAGFQMSAVSIGVAKRPRANATSVSKEILDRVDRLKADFIPQDVEVVVMRNDGKKANDSVNSLVMNLAVAAGAVILVLALTLGLKEALIVAATIPLAFSMTFMADLLFGVTLNRVTFTGLILSLGMLVDAAIVVIENIHRRFRMSPGCNRREAAITAVAEIGNPTNLATFAIMLVFVSLFTVTGMSGQYFFPVAFNVPIVGLASLLTAYIFTPWAAYHWLKGKAAEPSTAVEVKKPDRLHRAFLSVFTPIISLRKFQLALFAIIGVLFFFSAMQPAWQFVRPEGIVGPKPAFGVAMAFLPKGDKNTFKITIEMPRHALVEETDRLAREIETLLLQNENVLNFQSWIGRGSPPDFSGLLRDGSSQRGEFMAEIQVNLIDRKERKHTSIEIVRRLRPQIDSLLESRENIVVHLLEESPGPPVRATVLAEIYGADLDHLRSLSSKVAEEFSNTYDMVEVAESEPIDITRQIVEVDRQKAALSGVHTAEVARTLRAVLTGETLGQVHIPGETQPVPLVARVPRKHMVGPDQFNNLFVENAAGQRVPLAELIRLKAENADRPILHKDNERVAFVGGTLNETAHFYAVMHLNQLLDGLDIDEGVTLTTGNLTLNSQSPDTISGYQLFWDGEMRLMLDAYRDMLRALGVAMVAVYLLLVAYYRSLIIPLMAMSVIPLGLIGVFPGHWLLGVDFSATSMIGLVALAGVVVRNSLLIIDFVLDFLRQGMTIVQAVSEAAAVRVLPIVLTVLTTILGSIPLVADPVIGGLGVTLIFGSIAATIFTLFALPLVIYYYLHISPTAVASATELEK